MISPDEEPFVGENFIPNTGNSVQGEESLSVLAEQVNPNEKLLRFLNGLRVETLLNKPVDKPVNNEEFKRDFLSKKRIAKLYDLQERIKNGDLPEEVVGDIQRSVVAEYLSQEEGDQLIDLLRPGQPTSQPVNGDTSRVEVVAPSEPIINTGEEIPEQTGAQIVVEETEKKLSRGDLAAARVYLQELANLRSTSPEEAKKIRALLFDIEDGGLVWVIKDKIMESDLTLDQKKYLFTLVDPEETYVRVEDEENGEHEESEIKEGEDEGSEEDADDDDEVDGPDPAEVYAAYVDALPSEEVIREQLEMARARYAAQNVEYKNAVRQKKGTIKRFLSDLGVPHKQIPGTEKPPELIAVEAQYTECKKQLKVWTIEKIRQDKEQSVSKVLTEQAENEYEILTQTILENVPPLEKGIATKLLEKWARLPLLVRASLGASLVTGLFVVLGDSAGLTAAASGLAYRAGRSVVGGVTSQFTGKLADTRLKHNAAERKKKALAKYGELEDDKGAFTIDLEELDKQESEWVNFYEKEEVQSKRDRVKKILAMLAGGATAATLTTLGVNLAHASVGVGSADGVGPDTRAPGVRPVPVPVPASVQAPVVHVETPVEVPTYTPELVPVQVDISSRGYIDTFSHLKERIAEQYDPTETSVEVKELLTLSPEKLAIKFGFYKPGEELQSAFGVKGEHLLLDKDGSLVFEGLKGNRQVLFDAKTGLTHTYEGKMFNPSTHVSDGATSVEKGAEPVHAAVAEPQEVFRTPPIRTTHPAVDSIFPTKPSIGDAVKLPENHFSIEEISRLGAVASAGITAEAVSSLPQTSLSEAFLTGAALSDFPNFEKVKVAYEAPGGVVTVVENENSGAVTGMSFNDLRIATPDKDFKIPADILTGKFPLADDYQFDSKYKNIRTSYNIALERQIIGLPKGTFDHREIINYDGGSIMVLQKGNTLSILWNGRLIANGEVHPNKKAFLPAEVFKEDKYSKVRAFTKETLENLGDRFSYSATL